MKVYRLKHIPTGLYFTPSKGNGNLSRKGKLYAGTKPKLEWGKSLKIKIFSWKDEPTGHHKTIVEYFGLEWKHGWVDTYVKTNISDWEIEEVS